jgi:hypothetical protein
MKQTRFFDLVERLDVILKSRDIRNSIPELQDLTSDESLRKYFFEHLTDANWLEILAEYGFFAEPPLPKTDPIKQTIEFPIWPVSRYLARMASVRPDVVLQIILKIPETNNVRIHEDLTDAALAMPASMAAQWTRKEVKWIEMQERLYLILPDRWGALIKHLAIGNEVEQALALARSLLAVMPDPKAKEKEEHEAVGLSPEPQALFDVWGYEQILKKYIPYLIEATGKSGLLLLCDTLDAAIKFSKRRPEKEFPEDYSYVWRPAIEEHEQNVGLNLQDKLVSAVRDAAATVAEANTAIIPEIVEVLENRKWRVFRRIALYLLGLFPEVSADLIAHRLTDKAMFDEGANNHEYVLLMERGFGLLREENKEIILKWIEEGPDLEKFKMPREQWTGKRPSEEDVVRYKKFWQRDRLSWFKTSLTEDWKTRYELLIEELGEPQYPEFAVRRSTTWVGPTSPKSAEELRSMSIEVLVEFLKSWKPTEERMAPSPEGLGRVLSGVIVEDPNKFATESAKFQELDPTYVRALFSGLNDAAKQKKVFLWKPVLELCSWVVDQPREITGRRSEYADLDPGWIWTRKAIGELLSSGFGSNDVPIPYELRSLAWRVLKPLTEDPDPTPEREAEYGGSNMDPVTLSINTTRGEAMHAVIRYGLWVRRHIEKGVDGEKRVQRGFQEMPEVRHVLDQHLDPSQDASLAIRAVYGQWFPWIVSFDKKWATENTRTIFPMNAQYQDLRNAAWEAYIIFCPPYDSVFGVLREEYSRAIELLGLLSKEKRYIANPEDRLAEHLMTFYWRGKLLLDDEKKLLDRFHERAPDKVRGHAFDFIGRSLEAEKGAVPTEIIKRLRILWNDRFSIARLSPDANARELAAFGWWFASAKFDDEWSINQLMEVLKLTKKAEPDHLVIQRLAEVCKVFPRQCVECLRLMAEGDKEGWQVYGWREQALTILGIALQSSDPDIKAASENVVNYFGKRGYLEFRSLLQK